MFYHMKTEADFYEQDPLSTSFGAHVTGTEAQSECLSPCKCPMESECLCQSLWHQIRKMRITGTSFKEFSSNPEKLAISQWIKKRDLGHLKSISWGREKESVARLDYEEKTGNRVTNCGIFISKQCPLFAASPDGLVLSDNIVLIEIKCPFSLKDSDLNPSDVAKCAYLDGNACLRQSHQYFYQIQLGMFVTGAKITHFVV